MAEPSPIAKLAAKPPRFQIGVLIGTMVVLGLLYHQMFYSSLSEELTSAERRYAREEKKNKELKKQEREWQQMVKDKESLDIALNANQVSLPATAALASFIGNLQRQAAVAGVSFKNWSREQEVPVTGYVKVPISVEVVGNFHQILKYFYLLGNTKRIITVENFSLGPEKNDNDDVLLNAKFRATTFRQVDGAQPKAAASKKKSGLIEAGKAAKEKRESQVEEATGGKTDENGNPAKSGVDRLKNPGGVK